MFYIHIYVYIYIYILMLGLDQKIPSEPFLGTLVPLHSTWVWVKIKPPGDRRFWSMFPLTRVPFWAQPIGSLNLDLNGSLALVESKWETPPSPPSHRATEKLTCVGSKVEPRNAPVWGPWNELPEEVREDLCRKLELDYEIVEASRSTTFCI